MSSHRHVIIGCGDVGQRIVGQLLFDGAMASSITGVVRSHDSANAVDALGVSCQKIDFDQIGNDLSLLKDAHCFYLVPPQTSGVTDQRSRNLITELEKQNVSPKKVVLISTTGVYGDCNGEWVTEQSLAQPQTERGQRRLDSEQQWLNWAEGHSIPILVLRVPGIYANSRIPRERIIKRTPVVKASECGFTNRVHADDLAMIAMTAMNSNRDKEVYNATDGTPGKISDYLQTACRILGHKSLPEISMEEAKKELSSGMLSYLSESRKISNKKMLDQLEVTLRYPNYVEGLKFG